ncbi:Gag protease polyprotein, putative [Theobroma cacao]|uniref:Gag protease polyprotein, putative n=1 Tax=Theobroma cacao TaxID=3641 RepID=A0A061F9I6_THECC|nr:Gag protease polyprotein, putative [Theobroma cacao]
MPPRRELPPITRYTSRGRGLPRQSRSDSIEEESVASSFRATPIVESTDIPVPPPPSVDALSVPSMSPEVAQALAAFLATLTGQAQAGPVPPAVSPITAPVSETFADMGLDDEMKLKVATRLFEKRAYGQYYTYFHQKEKKREFLSLKQRNMTIEEYETRFNELMSYVPKLVRLEQDQVNYFEEGLCNEIRERMLVTGKESYKEVMQMALRAEKLTTENRQIRAEFAKRRNSPTFPDSGSDRSYVSISFASFSDRNLSPLEEEIVVHTPLGEQNWNSKMLKAYMIQMGLSLK